MDKEIKIFEELQKRYDFLAEKYGYNHILGIFLYGSQNYHMDLPSSDIDTKAIYVPSLTEICMNMQPISKELHYDNTHIEVKDIRLMCDMWKKQNINFVEILFTKYFIINPFYKDYWDFIVNKKQSVAHYDVQRTLVSIASQVKNTIKHEEVTGKQFANAGRLVYFLHSYIEGKSYEECLLMDKEHLAHYMEIKQSTQLYSNELELIELRKEVEHILKTKIYHDGEEELRVFLDEVFATFCKGCIKHYENLLGQCT